jgi:hypothetical protein
VGHTWISRDGTKRRLYVPDQWLAESSGLRDDTYKTGNISSASLNGEKLSNGKAEKLRTLLRVGKAYFDCNDGRVHVENMDSYTETMRAGLEKLAEERRKPCRPV